MWHFKNSTFSQYKEFIWSAVCTRTYGCVKRVSSNMFYFEDLFGIKISLRRSLKGNLNDFIYQRPNKKHLCRFRGAYQDSRLDLISKQHLLRPVQNNWSFSDHLINCRVSHKAIMWFGNCRPVGKSFNLKRSVSSVEHWKSTSSA